MTPLLEALLAAAALAACVVLLVRLALGDRRRYRFDASARRAWQRSRATTLRLYRWRATRREAAQAAEEAIHRARHGVQRDGNVYRPKSFREPRKPH
jgi:hypothetical protein